MPNGGQPLADSSPSYDDSGEMADGGGDGKKESAWDLFKEGYSNASIGGYNSPPLGDAAGIISSAAGGLATGAAARWGLGAGVGGPGSLAAQNSAALGGLATPLGWGLMLSVPIGKTIAGFGNIYFNHVYRH
ncbi:hypothetical protein [Mesoterricola sediminis]|uniref:hypothetical protein n=1 Tax=Mesoterricola sediminis TaxID=2927980 RepID=UPI00292F1795|nr:hypothetical protein [Mesoterricola sediminis]